MSDAEFFDLVETNAVALLDAPTAVERQQIADEISADPILASAVVMVLSESIMPLLPAPSTDPRQGFLQ